MITWTSAGAVERPTMVQIRVQRAYPGRVRAGAPVPTRSMTPEEVHENLRFFTRGLDTPRSQPCTRLVLSGVGVASREDSPEALRQARAWGVKHTVLHVGPEDLETFDAPRFVGLVDALVVPVQPGAGGGGLTEGAAAVRACKSLGVRVVATTSLTVEAVSALEPTARTIASAGPHAATFSYPFPISGNTSTHVPHVGAVVAALGRAVPLLTQAGVQVDLKGLPSCYLGELARLNRRSANRWYVDADHQRGDAVLFFPDVVRFSKSESCRFCGLDSACDGFFSTYLRRPGFPPLSPISIPAQPA
jgi:hypothetical protein